MPHKRNKKNYQNSEVQDARERVKYTDPDLPVEEIEFNTISREDIEEQLRNRGFNKPEPEPEVSDVTEEKSDDVEETAEEAEAEIEEECFEEETAAITDAEETAEEAEAEIEEECFEEETEAITDAEETAEEAEAEIEECFEEETEAITDAEETAEEAETEIEECFEEESKAITDAKETVEETPEDIETEVEIEECPEDTAETTIEIVEAAEETEVESNGEEETMMESESEETETKPKKKKSVVSLIIIIAALALMAFALYKLIGIKSEYDAGTSDYEEVVDKAVDKTQKIRKTKKTEADEEETELPTIDFAALEEINTDVVGWIYFEEPEIINYPITWNGDNDYYLTHTYTRSVNSAGSIFMDMQDTGDFTDASVLLYGHNMKNESMFGALEEYLSEEFALEHPYFYIYTKGGGVYRYRIYAVYKTDDNSQTYTVAFSSRKSYKEYLEYGLEQSKFDFDTKTDPDKPSITLSTCTNVADDERYVVQAILDEVITEGEPAISKLSW